MGVRETVQRFHSNDYGAVFIPNERLVGFVPLLGDLPSRPLDVHERIMDHDHQKPEPISVHRVVHQVPPLPTESPR